MIESGGGGRHFVVPGTTFTIGMTKEPNKVGVEPLVEHLFRRESGKLVASLTRFFGASHLELAEDVVQDTLLKAMREWPFRGIPDDPPAWLFRAAKNLAIDHLRRDARGVALLKVNAPLLRSEWTLVSTVHELMNEQSIPDDQLRMMFACCHPSLPQEQQVALALRTLCGFSVPEIAHAFVTNNETINKRLYRAREAFRNLGQLEIPSAKEINDRIEHVLAAIYLLFNEGYNSTEHKDLIREDLIEEALRLADQLTRNQVTDLPEVHALIAIMLYQASRSDARMDAEGAIVLLEDQDRGDWDHALIWLANEHLDKAATGDRLTTYHVEAGIASLHANAIAPAATDWALIVKLYDHLYALNPSSIVALNRAVALARSEGPDAGLNALGHVVGLEDHHLFHAVRGDLHRELGDGSAAMSNYQRAFELSRSSPEKALLRRKIEGCTSN